MHRALIGLIALLESIGSALAQPGPSPGGGGSTATVNAIVNSQGLITAPYVVQASDNNKTLAIGCNNPAAPLTIALEAPGFYPSNFHVRVMASCLYNGALSGTGVRIIEAGATVTNIPAYTLYPSEVANIDQQNAVWIDAHQPRWKWAAFRPNGPTTAITALAWAGASFNGYQVGDLLYVPTAPTGTIVPGQGVYRSGSLVERVLGYGINTTGGAGTYRTSTVGSIADVTGPVAFTTGAITATLGGAGSQYFQSNDTL